MHDNDLSRRVKENQELYGEIVSDESPTQHRALIAWVRGASHLGAAPFIGGTCMLIIGAMAIRGIEIPLPYFAAVIACIVSLTAAHLARGKHAETGQQRRQVPAQPGNPRASPRKTRARPELERGIEHGGHGQFAAAIVRDVLKAHFDKRDRLTQLQQNQTRTVATLGLAPSPAVTAPAQ